MARGKGKATAEPDADYEDEQPSSDDEGTSSSSSFTAKPRGTSRGRSRARGSSRGRGRASSASSTGSTSTAKSSGSSGRRSRNIEEEARALYEDPAAIQAAIDKHEVDAVKILAPSTLKNHETIFTRYTEWLAAAMDPKDEFKARVAAAAAQFHPRAELPNVKSVMEFARFYALGSTTYVKNNPSPLLTLVSLQRLMRDLVSAVSDNVHHSPVSS